MGNTLARLEKDVIHSGLCTHCGTCVGLSGGSLEMVETPHGPLPSRTSDNELRFDCDAYAACPGKGLDYPGLNEFNFGRAPGNWLAGNVRRAFIGYSRDPEIRRRGASGGVITQALTFMLQRGEVQGAVVLRHGWPRPWTSTPVIAVTPQEILAASQSVYTPSPVNTILPEMGEFQGQLAYVGLPDQVASLRALQRLGHPGARKVDVVLGPYVGTSMYLGAIESFLRSNGVNSLERVTELRYRAGEWPGYLQVKIDDGRVLRAEKFYYNYLIPFYITRSSLYSVDFTNELTDVSVGDAWHPRLERQGGGFSVVVVRSQKGESLLADLEENDLLSLEEIPLEEAMSMHGHMLDFKKRGAFIRIGWRGAKGLPVPDYGYRPLSIPRSRVAVEVAIAAIFRIAQTSVARRVVERLPLGLVGPLFDVARRTWKSLSKGTKRRGLSGQGYRVERVPTTAREGSRLPNENLAARVAAEIGHWRRRSWSFADVGAHWDAVEDYDAINEETYSYFRRFVDGLRLSDIPQGSLALDFCARTGNGSAYFHRHGAVGKVVCADVSLAMGAICRRRLQEAGVKHFLWVPVLDTTLPFASESFDAVLCFETVEHFPEPGRLLVELGRVTRPGGALVLTTPNVLWEPVHALAAIMKWHHSEGPHRFIPYGKLKDMVESAGFDIERAETTVLVPGGPRTLVRFGEWLERNTKDTLMPLLGLRRVIAARRR